MTYVLPEKQLLMLSNGGGYVTTMIDDRWMLDVLYGQQLGEGSYVLATDNMSSGRKLRIAYL